MIFRPRRLRNNSILRNAVAETQIKTESLIYPYFVKKGSGIKKFEIASMPNIFNFTLDALLIDIEESIKLGINKFLLFGVGDEKTEMAENAYNDNSTIPNTLRRLKAEFGNEIYLITDVCLCAYTSHGHCGVLANSHILNDPSLKILANMALTHAQAGADMIAPSDMMDGRVGAIRTILDKNNLYDTPIMSYSVKFASAYYGPFRDAADSAPQSGDRKSYQMDYRNINEAIKEIILDQNEGADIVMVKPALAYLDVIKLVKQNIQLPVACYNVSGEYAMVKAAAAKGWCNEQAIVIENMTAFTRAGANLIITYHAKDILLNKWL